MSAHRLQPTAGCPEVPRSAFSNKAQRTAAAMKRNDTGTSWRRLTTED